MSDLMAEIRAKVSAYLERTGMPEEDFGKRALWNWESASERDLAD